MIVVTARRGGEFLLFELVFVCCWCCVNVLSKYIVCGMYVSGRLR